MSDTRQPSPQLIGHLRDELRRHAPFDRLPAELADAFVLAAEQTYYAPGETLLIPTDGIGEARTARGAFFGEERLDALCVERVESASALVHRIPHMFAVAPPRSEIVPRKFAPR